MSNLTTNEKLCDVILSRIMYVATLPRDTRSRFTARSVKDLKDAIVRLGGCILPSPPDTFEMAIKAQGAKKGDEFYFIIKDASDRNNNPLTFVLLNNWEANPDGINRFEVVVPATPFLKYPNECLVVAIDIMTDKTLAILSDRARQTHGELVELKRTMAEETQITVDLPVDETAVK